MKKLILAMLVTALLSFTNSGYAYYATYWNGDTNYVIGTAGGGAASYVKVDSIRELSRYNGVLVLEAKIISLGFADQGNITKYDEYTSIHKYDHNTMKMYSRNKNGDYKYLNPDGPSYILQGIRVGEVKYAKKYDKRFYAKDNGQAQDDIYHTCLVNRIPNIPSELLGNWYGADNKNYFSINQLAVFGNKVFKIHDVTNNHAGIAQYYIYVNDAKSYYDFRCYNIGGQKVAIIGDGNYILHKNENISVTESIGGLYIGMPVTELYKNYGQPERTEKVTNYISNLYYEGDSWIVTECGGYIARIEIKPESSRRLDNTGLSANSSLDDFDSYYKKHYRLSYNPDYEFPNRFVLNDEVMLIKSNNKNVILVARSWLE